MVGHHILCEINSLTAESFLRNKVAQIFQVMKKPIGLLVSKTLKTVSLTQTILKLLPKEIGDLALHDWGILPQIQQEV